MNKDDQSPPLFEQYPCVERIALYRPGGFHPMHIGDIVQNRYRVRHKLGYGSYGTVWLVEDLSSGRCAALKVLAAEVSEKTRELAVLRHLRGCQVKGERLGREFVVGLLN